MQRSRLLIADDHTLVAEMCKKLLEPEFEVCGIVDDGRALVKAAISLRPDVVIADIAMPNLNGLDAAQQIRAAARSIKIIFLTMNSRVDVAAEAFRRGASAYLLKTCACSEIVTAVRESLRGKRYLSPSIPRSAFDLLLRQEKAIDGDGDQHLTARQREVLQLLAEGKVMKEVGSILNLSTRTVAFHKYRIMEVLGANSGADLVKYAIRNHIVAA